jgi:hypothetical protein
LNLLRIELVVTLGYGVLLASPAPGQVGGPSAVAAPVPLRLSRREAIAEALARNPGLVGMAAPHDLAVEDAGSVARVEVTENAIHPRSPAHFETAELKLHPACVACLLQAQTGTVLCHLPSAQKPLARDGGLILRSQRLATGEIPLTGPARAPPVLSLSFV